MAWRGPIFLILMAVLPAQAQIPIAGAPSSIRSDIASIATAVEQNAGRADAGQAVGWSSDKSSGLMTFRPDYSASRGPPDRCGACSDPCRSFRTSYRSAGGDGEFRGVACFSAQTRSYQITSLEQQGWQEAAAPPPAVTPPPAALPQIVITEIKPAVPLPYTRSELLAAMSPHLKALGYSATPDSTAAFDQYEIDYGLSARIDDIERLQRSKQQDVIDSVKALASGARSMAIAGKGAKNCEAFRTGAFARKFVACR